MFHEICLNNRLISPRVNFIGFPITQAEILFNNKKFNVDKHNALFQAFQIVKVLNLQSTLQNAPCWTLYYELLYELNDPKIKNATKSVLLDIINI